MRTILLADDHKNIREYCSMVFADEGYHVLLAKDGAEALAKFTVEKPDLVILDISMPRTSGLEALERIKRLSSWTPVILYTAHEDDCLRDRRALLATACIAKAADLSQLLRTVDRILRRAYEAHDKAWRMEVPPFPGDREYARPSSGGRQ
jgi:two-component system, OmpR family, response regulator VanR